MIKFKPDLIEEDIENMINQATENTEVSIEEFKQMYYKTLIKDNEFLT